MKQTKINDLLESIGPALRKNRERVAVPFENNPELVSNLIIVLFNTHYKLHFKAAWILEILLEKDLRIILPYIEYFATNIRKLRNQSAIRPIAKISMRLAVSYVNKKEIIYRNYMSKPIVEKMVETGFDWMIDDHKVATKAYTMSTLYYFGLIKEPEFEWIHRELKNIILQNMNVQSAVYQARGRITLELLKKRGI